MLPLTPQNINLEYFDKIAQKSQTKQVALILDKSDNWRYDINKVYGNKINKGNKKYCLNVNDGGEF